MALPSSAPFHSVTYVSGRARCPAQPQIDASRRLAWLLARKPFIAPIPGTSKVKHFQENLACTKLVPTAEDIKRSPVLCLSLRCMAVV